MEAVGRRCPERSQNQQGLWHQGQKDETRAVSTQTGLKVRALSFPRTERSDEDGARLTGRIKHMALDSA